MDKFLTWTNAIKTAWSLKLNEHWPTAIEEKQPVGPTGLPHIAQLYAVDTQFGGDSLTSWPFNVAFQPRLRTYKGRRLSFGSGTTGICHWGWV